MAPCIFQIFYTTDTFILRKVCIMGILCISKTNVVYRAALLKFIIPDKLPLKFPDIYRLENGNTNS